MLEKNLHLKISHYSYYVISLSDSIIWSFTLHNPNPQRLDGSHSIWTINKRQDNYTYLRTRGQQDCRSFLVKWYYILIMTLLLYTQVVKSRVSLIVWSQSGKSVWQPDHTPAPDRWCGAHLRFEEHFCTLRARTRHKKTPHFQNNCPQWIWIWAWHYLQENNERYKVTMLWYLQYIN